MTNFFLGCGHWLFSGCTQVNTETGMHVFTCVRVYLLLDLDLIRGRDDRKACGARYDQSRIFAFL
jgi:hypothetical protein